MNRNVFRLVLNRVAGMPVPMPAAEVSRGRGKLGCGGVRAQRRGGAACAALLGVAGPSLAFAAVVADPNGGAQRPGMATTANGTDLVNIVAPDATGLSHNKFNEFSPVGRGVVLNNSVRPGESQIGGMAAQNPNLMQPATRALLEVTQQRSVLQGTLEAFGGKLDVLVANQHGVTINGLTTLNVGRLGVTTGQVLPQAAGQLRLGVTQGDVLIDHGGIDTQGLDMFDVVSRSIAVRGPIHDSSRAAGADVRLVAGATAYDPQTGHYEAIAADESKAPVQEGISGELLGAMHGRHIVLVSTESGVGVRHDGPIKSANDIRVSANGEVTLGGPQQAAQEAVAGAQAVGGAGMQNVIAGGTVSVCARGHVAIQGAVIAGQDVDLQGKSVKAGRMSAQRDALVTAADGVTLDGPVDAKRHVWIGAHDDVVIREAAAEQNVVLLGRSVTAGRLDAQRDVLAAARDGVTIHEAAAAGQDVVLQGSSARVGQMSAQRDVLVMAADGVTLDGPVSAQRAVWVETQGDVAGSEWIKAGRDVQIGAAADLAGAVTAEEMQQLKAHGDAANRRRVKAGRNEPAGAAAERPAAAEQIARSARSTATAGGHAGSFMRVGDGHIAKMTTSREAEIYENYRLALAGVIPDTVPPEEVDSRVGVTARQRQAMATFKGWAEMKGQRVVVMQALGAEIAPEDKIELDVKIGASTVSRTELIGAGRTRWQALSKKVRLTAADLLRGSRSLVGDDRGYTLAGRTSGGIALDARNSRNSVGRSSESLIREALDRSPDTRWRNAQHLLGQLQTIREKMHALPLTFVASSVLIAIDKRKPENSVARLIDLAHPVQPFENEADYEKVNHRFEDGLDKLIRLFQQVEK
ncbi:inositol polyphosphate kinase family protein [Burkholderia pseudomallei]|uniref:inositol polyphosphate kinase family protein n=1 Tax=Burkholderia pseudomallei TaxID=28450 RepID=UPI000A1C7B45|nr:inositol polyphosphate kinase family protein [Burkholderia pseudomallei]